ncbi:MAG: WhiB family transcriptional regulator, redox-sensing transcriptional regulator [Pseudonocardiales bacterium]|jgi:WhiB family redox-sensing transcriptional regulator|nr:WhiB family transcriptional regulator, redox-sensing transcriptional regulator [Pseudonocardiales bacterium]
MTVIRITTRASDLEWLDRAACRAHDPELFFPVSTAGPGQAQTEVAKRVCRTCPVVEDCLGWAIASAIPFGVVGGLSEDERHAVARGTRRRISVPIRQTGRVAEARRSANRSVSGQLSDHPAGPS